MLTMSPDLAAEPSAIYSCLLLLALRLLASLGQAKSLHCKSNTVDMDFPVLASWAAMLLWPRCPFCSHLAWPSFAHHRKQRIEAADIRHPQALSDLAGWLCCWDRAVYTSWEQ